jgi:nicotinamidase-related amidase
MRLPADAVLLIFDAQPGVSGPHNSADNITKVGENIAALIAAWRAEGLPLAHIGGPPSALEAPLVVAASPLDGEMVIVRNTTSVFAGADLETRLEDLGATTLVLCGTLATRALEASACHATDLGYRVFVVADACGATDEVDLRDRLWPAEDVRALTLARLKGETATIVDTGTALQAAGTAKVRQRRATRSS